MQDLLALYGPSMESRASLRLMASGALLLRSFCYLFLSGTSPGLPRVGRSGLPAPEPGEPARGSTISTAEDPFGKLRAVVRKPRRMATRRRGDPLGVP